MLGLHVPANVLWSRAPVIALKTAVVLGLDNLRQSECLPVTVSCKGQQNLGLYKSFIQQWEHCHFRISLIVNGTKKLTAPTVDVVKERWPSRELIFTVSTPGHSIQ